MDEWPYGRGKTALLYAHRTNYMLILYAHRPYCMALRANKTWYANQVLSVSKTKKIFLFQRF